MNESPDRSSRRPPILERVGAAYFERLSADHPAPSPEDEIHILNPHEQETLKGIEAGAVLRATTAGWLSATTAALAAYFADPLYQEGPQVGWFDNTLYWLIVLGVTIPAAVLEIAFLYWDALRSVHQLSQAAGLQLFRDTNETSAVRNALVRAALELPSRREGNCFVKPGEETSRLRVLAAAIVYKLKITATNFLAKALVRRALGRVAVRSLMDFVAVPITAIWDGVVCWWVLREARIRAIGPSAAREITRHLFRSPERLSPQGKMVALRAVASVIARNAYFHPNLECFFNEVLAKTTSPNFEQIDDEEFGDSRRFLGYLAQLQSDEQTLALRVLAAAMMIDGRFSPWEKKLFFLAQQTCRRETSLTAVKSLRRSFRQGAADLLEKVDRVGVPETI